MRAPGRAGPIVLAAGILLIAAAQAVAPVAAPLFDSLTVLGPYRYLSPAGNQAGAPTSAAITQPLAGGVSPGFNAATTESPPQAQLIAAPGAFQLAPGTTSVTIRIDPVAPPAPSTVGPILGNVYRYAVTDQNGVALSTKPGTDVTLVLRAPDATSEALSAPLSGALDDDRVVAVGHPGVLHRAATARSATSPWSVRRAPGSDRSRSAC